MKKKLHLCNSIKVTAVLLPVLLTGCSNAKEYTTDVVKTGNIAEEIEVTGNIQGEKSTTYYAAVTSPISECDLEIGDIVKANELLLTYDTSDLERAYEQAVVNAQSTENSMNGQITASNKNASLYNKAVSDSNVYMSLYAIARASNDQINQSQYEENWDIANTSKAIEGQIAQKNKTIADKTSLANEKAEALLSLVPGSEEYKNHNNIKLTKTGIAMSYKMAQNLNVKQGDFVSWHIVGDDKWQKTRIAQIYRDPSVQGIAMKRDVFESLEYDFIPTGVLTNKSVDKSLTDEEEISTILNITDMKATFSKTMEMMYSMIFIMIFAATLLGFIVLYNLGVLSFVEKTREVATLKVLGFSSSKIRGILQKQNIWLTCIGIVFGIFAGIFVLVAMCSAVSESLDLFPVVSIPTYIYTVIGTFLVSIAVNFMFSGKVKTIDMVDALKGVE